MSTGNEWTMRLHWYLRIMDEDDKDVGFLASLLSYAHKHGALTDRQEVYAKRVMDRVHGMWERGELTPPRPGVTIQ